jgi:hypothetical protein
MSTDKVKPPEPVGRIYGYVGGRARVEWLRRPGGNRDPIYTEAQMLAMREQGRLAGLEERADELAKLREFAEAVMGDWPDVGGLDGFDLQALGVKHGLLERLERVAPCCDSCRCAEYETGPVECFRLTALLRPDAALAQKQEVDRG